MSDANSAHCLNFPDEWYAAYRVGKYQIQYFIIITVETTDKSGNSISKEVYISPSNKVVSNEFFTGRLIGDFLPSIPPNVLEEQILLRPFYPVDSMSPTDEWLLVNPSHISWNGDECNKIGVGFTGFQQQSQRCERPAGSCLGNQITDYLQIDKERKARGLDPIWSVLRKGKFTAQFLANTINLNMKYEHDITSNLLLEINADDLKYVVTEGKAIIDKISIQAFESLTTNGALSLYVRSMTSLPSSYVLSYNCSSAIMPLSSRTISLNGNEGRFVNSTVMSTTSLFANNNCTIDLKAKATGKILDTKFIAFQTKATNYTMP
jgi:Male gamete fusion factor